jgi:hypothetical protein
MSVSVEMSGAMAALVQRLVAGSPSDGTALLLGTRHLQVTSEASDSTAAAEVARTRLVVQDLVAADVNDFFDLKLGKFKLEKMQELTKHSCESYDGDLQWLGVLRFR